MRQAARRRLAREELERRLVDVVRDLDVDSAAVARNPYGVLEAELVRASEMVAALQLVVDQLGMLGPVAFDYSADEVSVRALAGQPAERRKIPGLFGPDHLGDGAAHVAVQMLGEWSDRAAKLAKLAIDCGLEERRVRIEEQTGQQLADVIKGTLAALRALVERSLPVELRRPMLERWDESVGPVVRHHIAAVTTDDDEQPPPLPALPSAPIVVSSAPVSAEPARVDSSTVAPAPAAADSAGISVGSGADSDAEQERQAVPVRAVGDRTMVGWAR